MKRPPEINDSDIPTQSGILTDEMMRRAITKLRLRVDRLEDAVYDKEEEPKTEVPKEKPKDDKKVK